MYSFCNFYGHILLLNFQESDFFDLTFKDNNCITTPDGPIFEFSMCTLHKLLDLVLCFLDDLALLLHFFLVIFVIGMQIGMNLLILLFLQMF